MGGGEVLGDPACGGGGGGGVKFCASVSFVPCTPKAEIIAWIVEVSTDG